MRKRKRLLIGLSFAVFVSAVAIYTTRSIDRRTYLQDELWYAVMTGRTADVKEALDQGALATERYGMGRPVPKGFWDYLKSLLHPSEEPLTAMPILFHAIRRQNPQIARLLLERGAAHGLNRSSFQIPLARDVLFEAVQMGDPTIVGTLVDCGADVDTREPPYQITPTMAAFCTNKPDVALELLKHGADPNAQETQKQTVLDFAIRTRAPLNVLQYLLDRGADPNAPSQTARYTPLMIAVKDGSPESVKLLLDRGADPNQQAPGNLTAYRIAKMYHRDKALQILQAAGVRQ